MSNDHISIVIHPFPIDDYPGFRVTHSEQCRHVISCHVAEHLIVQTANESGFRDCTLLHFYKYVLSYTVT